MMVTGTKYIYALCLKGKDKIEEFEKTAIEAYMKVIESTPLTDVNFAEMGKPFLMGYWDSLAPVSFHKKYTRLLDQSLAFYGDTTSFSSMALGFRYSIVKQCKVYWNEMEVPLKKPANNSPEGNKNNNPEEFPDKRCCINFKVDWSVALSSKVLLCSIEEKINSCILKIKSVAHSIQEACTEILKEANGFANKNGDKQKLLDTITKDLDTSIKAMKALDDMYKKNSTSDKNETNTTQSNSKKTIKNFMFFFF